MKVHSWLLTKKRGMHRTDSLLLGVITEFVFAVFCISAGIIGLVWIFTFFILPEWRVHERYERVECTFVDSRITPRTVLGNLPISAGTENAQSIFEDSGETPEERLIAEEDSDSKNAGKVHSEGKKKNSRSAEISEKNTEKDSGNDSVKDFSGEKRSEKKRGEKKNFPERMVEEIRTNLQDYCYWPEMQLRYNVDGVERTNWTLNFGSIIQNSDFPTEESARQFLSQWQNGKTYEGYYNPENPDQIVIIYGWQWENYIALVIPVSLFLIGFGILIHALSTPRSGSKESSAVRAAGGTARDGVVPPLEHQAFPYVPQIEDITDSPGIRLAFRLPIIDSPAWTLCILACVTLAWNFGCVLFLTVIACSFLQTVADGLMLLYLAPFLLVGVWLFIHTSTRIRNATAIGPTLVEVDEFPLLPGRTVRMFLSQRGEKRINWLNIVLICEEEAVFTHGTNTRREKQRVYQQLIFGEEGIDVTQEKSFDVEIPLTIPHDAMHSFVAPRNQINWRILIQGTAGCYPMFERSFPLVVYPAAVSGGSVEEKI